MTKNIAAGYKLQAGRVGGWAEGGWRHPIQDAGFRIQGKALEWADRLAY
jgi:hypothetical protein